MYPCRTLHFISHATAATMGRNSHHTLPFTGFLEAQFARMRSNFNRGIEGGEAFESLDIEPYMHFQSKDIKTRLTKGANPVYKFSRFSPIVSRPDCVYVGGVVRAEKG